MRSEFVAAMVVVVVVAVALVIVMYAWPPIRDYVVCGPRPSGDNWICIPPQHINDWKPVTKK